MTVILDPITTAELAALGPNITKVQWSNGVKTALGSNRKLICKHAASGDAWANGVIFADYDLTGTIQVVTGNLRQLGITSNRRTQLAVDLATGVAVLRITSTDGTRWIQGDVGLAGSGATFIMVPQTTASSPGFTLEAGFNAPQFLASGTGPVSPAWHVNTPKTLVLYDARTTTLVEVGRLTFNTRIADKVYQYADKAASQGDVAVWECSDTVTFGDIEAGAILERSHVGASESGTVPLEEVTIMMKVKSSVWADYPESPGYNQKTMSTYMPAHKWQVLNTAGAVLTNAITGLQYIEQQDGKAVNDPSMFQDEYYNNATGLPHNPVGSGQRWWDGNLAVRPHANCAMIYPWNNELPAIALNAGKVFKGVIPAARAPWNGKSQASMNGHDPLIGVAGGNSFANWWALFKWPQRRAVLTRPQPQDPYLINNNEGTGWGNAWAVGWGYEVAARGGIDHYTGPGGPRTDRAVIPLAITMYLSDLNWRRLEGDIPGKDLAYAWLFNLCNQSRHFWKNVRTAEGIPKAESLQGLWCKTSTYYGGKAVGPRVVKTNGIGASQSKYTTTAGYFTAPSPEALAQHYDGSGRHPWGFYLWETEHHGYNHVGHLSALFASSRLSLMQRQCYDGHWMGDQNQGPIGTNPRSMYGKRILSWHWEAHVATWMAACDHTHTYNHNDVEDRFQFELELMHDTIYKPVFLDNEQSFFANGIRNMGVPCIISPYGGGFEAGGNIFFYMAHVTQLMKVSGLWDKMKAKSSKCALVLKMLIDGMSKASIDWIIDTNGRDYRDGTGTGGYNIMTKTLHTGDYTLSELATSWADWNASYPSTGQASWVRKTDGTIQFGERDVALILRKQFAHIQKEYFPEYPNPRLDAAIAKYDGFIAERQAAIDAQTTPNDKRGAGWLYYLPSHGQLNPVDA